MQTGGIMGSRPSDFIVWHSRRGIADDGVEDGVWCLDGVCLLSLMYWEKRDTKSSQVQTRRDQTKVQAQNPGTIDMGSKREGCGTKKKKASKHSKKSKATTTTKSHDGSGTMQVVRQGRLAL